MTAASPALLLVSHGLGAVPAFVGGSPSEVAMGFVPSAGTPYADASFVDHDRERLRSFGFDPIELRLEDHDPASLRAATDGVDVLFVAGGNTFYLLDQVHRSGLAALLPEALERGLQYIGASAGAVIAGVDIELVRTFDDPAAAPGLTSFAGLGLVRCLVLPHFGAARYAERQREVLRVYGDRQEIVTLTDEQALLVDRYGGRRIVASR